MLKAHQACIDLEKNALRIQGREVQFLSEHELPEKARDPIHLDPATDAPAPEATAPSAAASTSFPGGGRSLGAVASGRTTAPTPQRARSNNHPEESIRMLMDLGASRELAISTLEASGGNVDVAASLLF